MYIMIAKYLWLPTKCFKNLVVYLIDFFDSTIQDINYQLKNVSAVHIATY